MKKLKTIIVIMPILVALTLILGMAFGSFVVDDTKVIAIVVCVIITYFLDAFLNGVYK